MADSQKPLAKKKDIVVQELPDELLIYDLSTDKAFCLNKTSAFVWQTCDGTKNAGEIARAMSKEFKTSINEDFVWLALDQLAKDDLLENKLGERFKGISRRDVIRRVGLASVIALPIVASLVAPTAVSANACSGTVVSCGNCPDGTPCTMNCSTGTHCECTSGSPNCVTNRISRFGSR